MTLLKEQLMPVLIDDEGYKEEIYLDHLGHPTFGIGHLVTRTDPEYGQPVGAPVSQERVLEAFNVDVDDCIRGAYTLDENMLNRPLDAQIVLTCMVFQMGRNGVSKFRNMLNSLHSGDYKAASEHMLDSRWATQTPARANRLARRMYHASRSA